MEAVHYVYALTSTSSPKCVRYVGMTSRPQARIKQHFDIRNYGLVNAWCRMSVLGGDTVRMLCLASLINKPFAMHVEQTKIHEYATTDLLNGQTWYTSQLLAGVPQSVSQAYKMSLMRCLTLDRDGDDRESHSYAQIARVLQCQFMTLNTLLPRHKHDHIEDLEVLATI